MKLELNIYKNQKEIEKTYEVDCYDLMYGTLEDILEIISSVNSGDNDEMIKVISNNRDKLNDLLMDVFDGVTKQELRRVKVKDLIPIIVNLFQYALSSFDKSDSKN